MDAGRRHTERRGYATQSEGEERERKRGGREGQEEKVLRGEGEVGAPLAWDSRRGGGRERGSQPILYYTTLQ